jgi:hypothetical protein
VRSKFLYLYVRRWGKTQKRPKEIRNGHHPNQVRSINTWVKLLPQCSSWGIYRLSALCIFLSFYGNWFLGENTKKILIKMYGLIKDLNGWRIRTNDGLQVIYKTKYYNNNKNNKTRLRCHLVRISDDRTVKKLLLGTSVRTRTASRSKLTWLGCIENDLK